MADSIIEVEGINKYFGDKHVVKDVSLNVQRGEIYGFLGPNGSGKTTTLRILCGLLLANSGQGHCLNFPLNSPEIKANVGYMTQRFSFYEDLTIYENLLFVARLYGIKNKKKVVNEAIQSLGLYDRRNQLTGSLSGGWKQRVALTACLLHKPKLLLLDEPTAGVDPKARREFWTQIHELSLQGITTLVSTHYMDEAERCTKLAYIAYGNLLVKGTTDDVIKHVGLTTYSLDGDDIHTLSERISKLAGVSQVTVFGRKLHVSGSKKAQLEHSLKEFLANTSVNMSEIPVELEDAFIALVSQSEDNFNEN